MDKKEKKKGRPRSDEPMKIVGVRLQSSLVQGLRKRAEEEGLPYQTYLRKVLWDHLYKKKGERNDVKGIAAG